MSSNESTLRLAKHQKFEIERIQRSQIKNAPYNPRTIDQYAKKKILDNLKRVGLVQPIVVNKNTMHIVAGHQRLLMLDLAEKENNYLLDVSMCSLTDKEEREQNVFMNNPSAMGTWDLDALQDLVLDAEVEFDFNLAGFEKVDLDTLIEMPESVIDLGEATEAAQAHIAEIGDHAGTLRETRKNRPKSLFDLEDVAGSKAGGKAENAEGDAAASPDAPAGLGGESAADPSDLTEGERHNEPGDDYEKEKEDWREIRGSYVEKRKIKDDHRFFAMVVFEDAIKKQIFFEALSLPIDTEYIDGERLGEDLSIFQKGLPEGCYTMHFNERGDEVDQHGNVLRTLEEMEAQADEVRAEEA